MQNHEFSPDSYWVCYAALGKQLAAGPYPDAYVAQGHQIDIASYAGVTACFVYGGARPPRPYVTLVDVLEDQNAAGMCPSCGGPVPPGVERCWECCEEAS